MAGWLPVTKRAVSAPNATRTFAGMPAIEKAGMTAINAEVRSITTIHVVKNASMRFLRHESS